MFLAAFIVAGLNFRFGWIVLQNWIVYAAKFFVKILLEKELDNFNLLQSSSSIWKRNTEVTI
jgi:hypothetical protein